MYALILDSAIQSVGRLPAAARRLDTGEWVCPPNRDWTDEQAALCGYLPVTDVARPADTATDTWTRSVELVAGAPTVVWTARPWTADELAAQQAEANRTAIEQAAAAAMADNDTIIAGADTYLAIASPTNAQVVAQVRALTQAARMAAQQRRKLIRLQLNDLTGTE